ncbi:BMP family ABC transporter substrate-binding protein [Mesomycoplasma molare]|uniref:BMP family ABC transporter substrate-binding protein n=1 Tax=Mesomycoplasma molare TaxID=171288 RepID=A0ABY5TWX0_9BACT|nr:BMP family ABC transporter substrate-binding protein [Mesomycoplasma molare]UWD34026.1 BMP family ABC transporter substrate-binding protein [Mesomycoplasma molare]
MKFSKKLLLGLGSSLTGLASIATVISCAQDSVTDYSGIKAYVSTRDTEVKQAVEKKEIQDLKITLLTAGGNVNDKSFNQSLWEAISQHSSQADRKDNKYILGNSSKLEDSYNALMSQDSNVWVLTGFQHGDQFAPWYAKNKENFDKKGIIVIAIDWDAEDSKVPAGKFISLNYNTDEAGWIAGYAIADYLATKETNDENRKVVTFAGGAGAGVTDFIAGYLSGIKKYNSENSKVTKLHTDNLELNAGFVSSDSKSDAIVNGVVATGAKVILPVAGSLTSNTLNHIKTANKSQLIIGVDTDQSKAFEKDKNLFFTSIEKRLGNTLYRVITDLFVKKGNKSDIISGFEFGKTNAHLKLGYHDGFVGVSPSSIEDKVAADASLKKAEDKFKELVTVENKSNVKTILEIPSLSALGEGNKEKLENIVKEINKQTGKTTSSSTEATTSTSESSESRS